MPGEDRGGPCWPLMAGQGEWPDLLGFSGSKGAGDK